MALQDRTGRSLCHSKRCNLSSKVPYVKCCVFNRLQIDVKANVTAVRTFRQNSGNSLLRNGDDDKFSPRAGPAPHAMTGKEKANPSRITRKRLQNLGTP